MTEFKNPFVLPVNEYIRDINTLDHYVKDVSTYLHIRTGKPLDFCNSYVKSNLSKNGKYPFKDKNISYLERNEYGDRVQKTGTLNLYIKDSLDKKHLIAPTLTTYIPGSQKHSVLSNYISDNIKRRASAKKKQFQAKADGDTVLESIKKLEQTLRKLSNNAISGAHVSPSTPIYNKTAHSTLTSTCRSTSGYGNANNEKLLSGNRHYFNHHIVLNNIISIVNNTDYIRLQNIINKYNLYLPTPKQTLDSIKYSTCFYFKEEKYFNEIQKTLEMLTPIQRAAFLYTGDMYQLKTFNENVVKTFIDKLSTRVTGEVENPLKVLNNTLEDHLSLAHQICIDETKGIGKDYSKIHNTPAINTLALTCLNIEKTLTDYSDLIICLFTTKNLPASMAHFPDSIRRSAITSDTDSTIFTVQDWVMWMCGGIRFDSKAMAVAATMIFLASANITHILAVMSRNFGIEDINLFEIAMKNEYKFDVFIPTQLGKHYFANKSCQEGNVFSKHEIEVKGVHLKSSNSPKPILEKSNAMMEEILNDIMVDGCISGIKYLKQVANIEKEIIRSVQAGEHTYFRSSSIKNAESYTAEKELSPYMKHLFWNNVFGPKYGIMQEPPYGTMKISVDVDNATKFRQWVSKIEDREFANRLSAWMLKEEKTNMSTFYIPTQCLTATGLPKELITIIDYRKIIIDCCNIFYIILETLGIYMNGNKSNRIVSDDY